MSLLNEHAATVPEAAVVLGTILLAVNPAPADVRAAVAHFCSASRRYLELAQARGARLQGDDYKYFTNAVSGIGQALVQRLDSLNAQACSDCLDALRLIAVDCGREELVVRADTGAHDLEMAVAVHMHLGTWSTSHVGSRAR